MNKEQVDMIENFGKYMAEAPEEVTDIEKLIDHVIAFLEYIKTDEMQKLENDDPDGFERHLDNKFSDFTMRYYAVFKLLLDKANRESNVARMLELFQNLSKVKSEEKTMDKAYEEFTEDLNVRYIYSKFGGKDKFEQNMVDQNKTHKVSKKNKHKK